MSQNHWAGPLFQSSSANPRFTHVVPRWCGVENRHTAPWHQGRGCVGPNCGYRQHLAQARKLPFSASSNGSKPFPLPPDTTRQRNGLHHFPLKGQRARPVRTPGLSARLTLGNNICAETAPSPDCRRTGASREDHNAMPIPTGFPRPIEYPASKGASAAGFHTEFEGQNGSAPSGSFLPPPFGRAVTPSANHPHTSWWLWSRMESSRAKTVVGPIIIVSNRPPPHFQWQHIQSALRLS